MWALWAKPSVSLISAQTSQHLRTARRRTGLKHHCHLSSFYLVDRKERAIFRLQRRECWREKILNGLWLKVRYACAAKNRREDTAWKIRNSKFSLICILALSVLVMYVLILCLFSREFTSETLETKTKELSNAAVPVFFRQVCSICMHTYTPSQQYWSYNPSSKKLGHWVHCRMVNNLQILFDLDLVSYSRYWNV